MSEKADENPIDIVIVKSGNCCKSIRNYFREYCRCTSIHGFRYFGEKRTIFERVWWFFIFVICLAACVISIHEVYKKWERSPVIVSFATRGTPIYKIPFPAVTVCPEIKSKTSKFNFTDVLYKKQNNQPLTSIEVRNFEYMSLICNYNKELNYMNNYTFADDFFNVIDDLKPDLIVVNCRYMGAWVNCSKIFTPIITDEGVCYTFNMLGRDEIFRENVVQYSEYHKIYSKSAQWTMEDGYSDDAGIDDAYPKRALLAGAKNAFSVSLITNRNDTDYACRNSLLGYRILLHTPMRLPRPSQEYFRVPLNQAVVGVVQPNMIVTSDSVKMYNPKRRECYFPSERHLKYFKIYTQLNCFMECETNYTLHICGCVNFFMPRENDTEICGTGSIDCMRNAEMSIQMKNVRRLIINEQKTSKIRPRKFKRNCDCLPICSDLSYDVETSQTDWEWDKEEAEKNYQTKSYLKSSLTIYFKSNHFITSQRHELYGPTDFLANFGGLLGLFTGFSILSLMEIIYFLTVRLICNIRLYGYWAGPEN